MHFTPTCNGFSSKNALPGNAVFMLREAQERFLDEFLHIAL
jgi:hypothetical protein